jgi:hypothetical protein
VGTRGQKEMCGMTFQNVVYIRHKVANYRKWKAVFDAHGPARTAQGCQGTHVFRRADNPKELVIMLSWSDLGKARQFLVSDDLREMLAETPLCDGVPDVVLLEELDQVCRATPSDRRPSALDEPSATCKSGVVVSSASTLYEASARRSRLTNPDSIC